MTSSLAHIQENGEENRNKKMEKVWWIFAIDALGDHVSTCTAHSGAKKAHDWTSRTQRARCLWCWTSALPMTDSEVALTLVLMDTYITLMI